MKYRILSRNNQTLALIEGARATLLLLSALENQPVTFLYKDKQEMLIQTRLDLIPDNYTQHVHLHNDKIYVMTLADELFDLVKPNLEFETDKFGSNLINDLNHDQMKKVFYGKPELEVELNFA